MSARERRPRDRDAEDELTATLRVHARMKDLVPHVGDGWLPLVRACHEAVVAEFPDYELLAVKQKYGELAFQAFPAPWAGPGTWTADESRRLDAIVERFEEQSHSVCEECGRDGEIRLLDGYEIVLCDACLAAAR